MMKPSIPCEEFREGLDALLADTLEAERARAIRDHKDSCQECEKLFESSRDLLSSFSALSSPSPRSYVIENLERSIEAAQRSITLDSLWARLWSRPTYRMISAMALGLLAAFVSTLSFSQVALTLEGLTQTLLVCALFWTCGYFGMFDLAFRRSPRLQFRNSFNLMRMGERIAVPVLIALGAATLGLLATTPYGGLGLIFSPFDGFGSSLAQPVPYSGWFLFGVLIGGVSLLLGVNLAPGKTGRPLLFDGVFAGSLFVLLIAPGFAIICVPFTLGLFFTLSAGLAIGALSGGILGFWSVNFLRMRLWRI